jgi:integrase
VVLGTDIDLAKASPPAVPGADALRYIEQAKALATRRGYTADLRERTDPTRQLGGPTFSGWIEWCDEHGRPPLPADPATICDYLTTLASAGAKAATIQRRVSAISQAHQAAGFSPSPTQDWIVRQTLRGIRRTIGTESAQKDALSGREVARLVALLPHDLSGRRDRALLLIGLLGAFRRSELSALDVEDIRFTEDGLLVAVRRSKTDQEAAGTEKGIPRKQRPETDPVRTLRAWLDTARITTGPIWRPINRHGQLSSGRMSPAAIADVVKRACARAGLDPDRYAGHSLRAGLATAARKGRAPADSIKRQGGWKSDQYQRYIRHATLFEDNAGDYVEGL